MRKNWLLLPFLTLTLLIVLSIFIGRYSLFGNKDILNDPFGQRLIINIRIPRILIAVLSGIALSLSGYVLQVIFRNPLADPGIIGISQASGFGAAFAILFFQASSFYIQTFAFLFSILALFLTSLIASKIKAKNILSLVLSGIAVSALFSAALGMLKYLADPIDELPTIIFWLLGSLANAKWENFYILFSIVTPVIIFLYLYRWRLNIHNLDYEVSFSLGLRSNIERNLLIGCAVLLTSSVISLSGLIGWVGLIIPNLSRLIFGSNTEKSLPFSAILGAIFLLISDDLSRVLLPGEIPIGILTALFGASLFIFILFYRKIR